MKISSFAVAGLSILATQVALQGSALASPPRGVTSQLFGSVTASSPASQGGTCLDSGCVGDMIRCEPGQTLMVVSLQHSFLEGVCDDRGDTPCGGRLSQIDELCLDPTTDVNLSPDPITGPLLTATPRGRFRVCFDASGPSVCTGSPPSGQVIGEGRSSAQIRQLLGASPANGNVELDMERARSFEIDGRRRRLRVDLTVGDFTVEPDVDQNNCDPVAGTRGCGISVSFVAEGR